MGVVCWHVLQLYCDHPGCTVTAGRFEDVNYSKCAEKARKVGWHLNRAVRATAHGHGKGMALCPEHAKDKADLTRTINQTVRTVNS